MHSYSNKIFILQLHAGSRDTFDEILLEDRVKNKDRHDRDNTARHKRGIIPALRSSHRRGLEVCHDELECGSAGIAKIQERTKVRVVVSDKAEQALREQRGNDER